MLGINKLLLIDLILFYYMVLQEQSLFSSVSRHPLVELLIFVEILMEGAMAVRFLYREFLTARLIV
jgi:hypothetical protein